MGSFFSWKKLPSDPFGSMIPTLNIARTLRSGLLALLPTHFALKNTNCRALQATESDPIGRKLSLPEVIQVARRGRRAVAGTRSAGPRRSSAEALAKPRGVLVGRRKTTPEIHGRSDALVTIITKPFSVFPHLSGVGSSSSSSSSSSLHPHSFSSVSLAMMVLVYVSSRRGGHPGRRYGMKASSDSLPSRSNALHAASPWLTCAGKASTDELTMRQVG